MLWKIVIFLLINVSSITYAAEIKYLPRTLSGPGPSHIRIEGTILEGDAKKLSDWIKANPAEYIITSFVELSSNGGSVTEAIKIAEIVEKSG